MQAGLNHARDVALRADAQIIICVSAGGADLILTGNKTEVTGAVRGEGIFVFRVGKVSAVGRQSQIVITACLSQQVDTSARNWCGTTGASGKDDSKRIDDNGGAGAWQRRH